AGGARAGDPGAVPRRALRALRARRASVELPHGAPGVEPDAEVAGQVPGTRPAVGLPLGARAHGPLLGLDDRPDGRGGSGAAGTGPRAALRGLVVATGGCRS